jgi:hypothetical protein
MQLKTFFFFFVALCASSTLSAQWNMVQETERNMSFGSRPCFRLEFAKADPSLVEDLWKDYVKNNFKGKLKRDKGSGEWFATGLKSNMMDGDVFGVYSTIDKSDKGTVLTVWIDAGTYFLSRRENSGKTEEVSRSLRTYYFDVRRAQIGKEIKDQEAKLKDMDLKQKKLQKENESLRKDIEAYKAKLKKAEDDVVKNEKDQETTILDTEAQRKVLEDIHRRLDNVENEHN